MTASDRFLAWLAQTLPLHEPSPDLSFTEAQARFTAVVQGALALERGGGMLFGLVLPGEHVDALTREGLPALRRAADAWRAFMEERWGARGLEEVTRIAALLGYMPLVSRAPLVVDPRVREALEAFIASCLAPAGGAARPRCSVAMKEPSGDRYRQVVEYEAYQGARLHPHMEALYATLDGLALLDARERGERGERGEPGAMPACVPWPEVLPPATLTLVMPLAASHLIRKSARAGQGSDPAIFLSLARLPRDFDRVEEERGAEIRLGLHLAFLAGTSAIHLTDETYGGASRLLAPDLVSFFERLGAHAGGVRAFLEEAACDLAGGAA